MEEGGKQGALWSMGISTHCAQNSTLLGVVGGGGGGRRGEEGKVTSFTYILSPERSQHFLSPPDLHSGLTHPDMASFFRNPY